jgi:cytochrome c oxidase cbb3-type subunit 3
MTPRALLVLGALLACACWRERRELQPAAVPTPAPLPIRLTEIQRRALPGGRSFDGNAYAISEGRRLYQWFNCTGCHGNGGGGSGPALMDDRWLYGSGGADVYTSIAEGRPNGMPSFGSQLRPEQVSQLTAYVRSLSGLQRPDTVSPRADTMAPQSVRQTRRR